MSRTRKPVPIPPRLDPAKIKRRKGVGVMRQEKKAKRRKTVAEIAANAHAKLPG